MMLINSEERALEAIDLCLQGKVKSINLSGWPVTSIKLDTGAQPGLFSFELQGLIELQRAIDDQYPESVPKNTNTHITN